VQLGVPVDDGLEQLHPVFAAEGREAADHFVDEAAEAPPVHVETVAHFLDDLGSQVLGGATNGGCVFLVLEDLRQSEVSQLDVPRLVDDDVLRLQTAFI
jgi:hypothetical protein